VRSVEITVGCLAEMRCDMYIGKQVLRTIGDLVLVKDIREICTTVIHPQHGPFDMDRAFLKFVSSAEAQ